MAGGHESPGMKEHFIRHQAPGGEWSPERGLYRIVAPGKGSHLFPYGIHLMDNGKLILLAGLHHGPGKYSCVVAFSSDLGATWSEFHDTSVYGRPVATAYLGKGRILFANETLSRSDIAPQWTMSGDYGSTWEKVGPVAPAPEGTPVFGEGDVFVDDVSAGETPRLMYTVAHSLEFPVGRHTAFLRSSADCGRTRTEEVSPREWIYEVEHQGRRFERSVCEGTLVRARNGWLVAALRTDMHPRYFDVPHNDSLMGLATSVSKDGGRSWAALNVLYDAGRHHPNLLLLPNGDIVMTYIVRADVRGGRLASYRRGCEAAVSRDNGLTWDIQHTYFLDEYEFFDGEKWFNGESGHLSSTLLDDGSVLTAYGNYLSRGCALIRWNAK